MGPMSPQRLGVWTGMGVRPLAPERGHRQCSRGMVGTSPWSLPLPATHTQGGGITLSRDKCPLGGVTLTLRWATGKCIRSRGRTGDSLEGLAAAGAEAAQTLGWTYQPGAGLQRDWGSLPIHCGVLPSGLSLPTGTREGQEGQ